jgi:hypothetical protein
MFSAIERPMPRLDPVTMQTFPVRSNRLIWSVSSVGF